MTDDRSAFTEARDVGLRQRHEQRLDRATYTAAEVRVLTDAALLLGRSEAAEAIAEAIEEESAQIYWGNRHHLHEAAAVARQYARDIGKGDPNG